MSYGGETIQCAVVTAREVQRSALRKERSKLRVKRPLCGREAQRFTLRRGLGIWTVFAVGKDVSHAAIVEQKRLESNTSCCVKSAFQAREEATPWP